MHALDLRSIAFPAIGAGVAGLPFEKVATIMSEAISRMMNEQAIDRLTTDIFKAPLSSEKVPDIERDVFISYSRKDMDLVKPIYEWLENAGCPCWLDVDGMFSGVSLRSSQSAWTCLHILRA